MRSAATMLAALAALAPSVARAAPPSDGDAASDLLPDLALQLGGRFAPSITFSMRAAAGHDETLFGPYLSAYRATPQILFGIQPEPHLQLFAGGGAGPARVIADPGAPPWCAARNAVSFAGALGARFPFQGAAVHASAEAEAVDGYGALVMLRLELDLVDAK